MYEVFYDWCDARMNECAAQQASLAAEGRGDEATFMQIRRNVYGIFRSACQALKGDLSALRIRVNSIPTAWERSLDLAQRHGDAQKVCIEQIKLETVADIRRFLTELEAEK